MSRHVMPVMGETMILASALVAGIDAARERAAERVETDRWNALVARVQAAESRAASLERELVNARAEARELEDTAFALATQNEALRAARIRAHA